MRQRVLITANTSWNLFNFRAGLIRGMLQRDYDVIALAPPDAYSHRVADMGCRYIPLPMDNQGTSIKNDALLSARFWQVLKRERPDAFLAYTIKPNIYGSLAAHALGIPVINNISGLGTAFLHNRWLTFIVKQLYRAALRRSRVVFFQNDDDRALFMNHGLVRSHQAALVPGSGISLETFRPAPFPDENREGVCFLLIARLLWDKGIGEYVEAARIVRRRFPSVRFRLLGPPETANRTAVTRATVQSWVDEGIVEYLGEADDVRPHIAGAHCVVLPSYREGTPRTLLEAAAMGRPLIATDVPGCREVVIPGQNGYLCLARDATDLARKVMLMAQSSVEERAAMGAASRTRAEKVFDDRIIVERYLRALDRTLTAAEV